MKTYRVRNGSALFETAETRKLKHLQWVAVPNKHDGKGYKRLLRLQDGPLVYAAWLLILQVASKCPKRWTLADDDGPLTPQDLADKTDFPVEYFERAFKALIKKEIGWLELEDTDEDSGSAPATSPATPATPPEDCGTKGIEGNGIEGNGREENERAREEPEPPGEIGCVLVATFPLDQDVELLGDHAPFPFGWNDHWSVTRWWATFEYRQRFKDARKREVVQLSIHWQEQVAFTVQDRATWDRALRFWDGNGYKAKSVEKLLNKYGELLTERTNGPPGKLSKVGQGMEVVRGMLEEEKAKCPPE